MIFFFGPIRGCYTCYKCYTYADSFLRLKKVLGMQISIMTWSRPRVSYINNLNLIFWENIHIVSDLKIVYVFQSLHNYYFFINLFILFIYFWLRSVFVAARGLSLVAVSGGYSLLRCVGFSLWWLLLLQSMGSRCAGFSSCSTRAQELWRTGLAAPRHVGSSRTRARTRVPCTGRRILNCCTTREAPP